MKFDPYSWLEFVTNEEISVGKGQLRLRLSAPAAVYVTAQGFEALAGFGSSFDLEVSEAVSVRVDAPEGVRAFRWKPPVTAVEPDGEVFTNIDRMPDESGSLLEVRRALRMLEFERRAALRDIRAARDRVKPEREPVAVVPPDGAAQAEPAGEAEVVE